MWVVEHISQQAVVDAEAIAKVGCLEGRIAYLAAKLCLKPSHGPRECTSIEIVPCYKEVNLHLKNTREEPGEGHKPQDAGSFQSSDDILRSQHGRIADEALKGREMLEARINPIRGFRTDSALNEDADTDEFGQFATSCTLFERTAGRYVYKRECYALVE